MRGGSIDRRERVRSNTAGRHSAAKFAGLVEANACPLPLTQAQFGEMLGMSLVSVNRNLQALRQTKAADHRAGKLVIRSWPKLALWSGRDGPQSCFRCSLALTKSGFSSVGHLDPLRVVWQYEKCPFRAGFLLPKVSNRVRF
jgi:hypothetical protein